MQRQHKSGTNLSDRDSMSTGPLSAPGQWQPGQSGNPAGRPVGSKNRKSLLAQQLEEQGSLVAQRVIEAALAGDMQAASIVLQRICPPLRPQSAPVNFTLNSQASLAEQAQDILSAVASGFIDPETGRSLINCLGTVAGLMQTDELSRRLDALELRS